MDKVIEIQKTGTRQGKFWKDQMYHEKLVGLHISECGEKKAEGTPDSLLWLKDIAGRTVTNSH